MLAQATLIPSESKKLIATAIANMDMVKKAVDQGMIVMHPSSSSYFLVEELTGHKPRTNVWACGIIVPKGACIEIGSLMARSSEASAENVSTNPESFSHSWIIRQGKLSTGRTLESLFNEMGPNDVYLKGVNALDTTNTVGILIGNPTEGGTIARVLTASKRRGFKVIFPVGLEKLVPFSIREVAKIADRKRCDYSMGIPCSLLPCEGDIVTEIQAIEILSGATVTPIAAGGLGGAEGAITFVMSGNSYEVNEAIKHIERVKGVKLPQVRTSNCYECTASLCTFPVGDKHWA
jgi:hypothetical protein